MNNTDFTLVAKQILNEIMVYRRVPQTHDACKDIDCQKCAAPHFAKILAAVEKNIPVPFVLPAFPGKSPNPEKVLGHLPDHAEQLALRFLGDLCNRIKTFYAPGIKIKLCSDGRVFSDIIGMKETHVTDYQIELDKLINEMSLKDISTFNLDDVYKTFDFHQMRDELMKKYGASLESLKLKVKDEYEANHMYRGITRFMFEDAIHAGQTKSRTAVQKEARAKAYEVIRRSNAWTTFIAEYFPEAVRLSIHPQICGSEKLGIRLIGNESWMTPWHGVAVKNKSGYMLLKRKQAEELGAKLIYSADGRGSHYQLESVA